jgi:uncharacterized protein YegJ (DUF2314 family)
MMGNYLYTSQGKIINTINNETFVDQLPNIPLQREFSCQKYNKQILEKLNTDNCKIKTDIKDNNVCEFIITCGNIKNN